MTVTQYEYAEIAEQVYGSQSSSSLPGWTCRAFHVDRPVFSGGSLISDGFQGGSYYRADSNELVIGFKGTVPTMVADLTAI